MDELRLALIGIGIFAIAGILVHGMWTIRKNKRKQDAPREEQTSGDVQDPLITISDDDPLLSTDANDLHKESLSDTSLELTKVQLETQPEIQESPQRTVIEDDLLVGDAPLYEQSDLQQTPAESLAKKAEAKSDAVPSKPNKDVATPVSDIPSFVANTDDAQSNYDDDGIGEVRVVDTPVAAKSKPESSVSSNTPLASDEEFDAPEPPSSLLKKEPAAPSINQSRVDHDEIPMIDTSIDIDDAPPAQVDAGKKSGALKSEHTRTEVVGGKKAKSESFAEKARKLVSGGSDTKKAGSKKPTAKKRVEPAPEKDQIRLDLEASEDEQRVSEEHSTDAPQQDQEVLILNVKVPEGKVIQGSVLLPTLLTLGFKFGEHNMFHRHAASNGKGPKLFTLANMYNPGTFDIDNMENFNTTGVSLFMILPIEADAHQVFNMMHNAARKMADEFGAQVLDGRRSVLTKQSLQQYVEKIREFERRRMIRRA